MKFAKVLFFVCVIGLCAALERTVSKAETEYMASTKAAKAEVGYREMMDFTLPQVENTNQKVTIVASGNSVKTVLDMQLLSSKAFQSGIPFYFSGQQTSSPIITKYMIKLNQQVYYIPFNTLLGNCNAENVADQEKPKLLCQIENKNGISPIMITFEDLEDGFMGTFALQQISKKISYERDQRKSFIAGVMYNIGNTLNMIKYIQYKIEINKKEVQEKRKLKIESIEKLKKQIAELTAAKNALEKEKNTNSASLQVIKNSGEEATKMRIILVSKRISYELTIKTLTNKIQGQSAIDNLNKLSEEALTKLKYYLQGSVYHRIITETEMTGLVGMVLNDSQFDAKVNDYFFPQ